MNRYLCTRCFTPIDHHGLCDNCLLHNQKRLEARLTQPIIPAFDLPIDVNISSVIVAQIDAPRYFNLETQLSD